MKLEDALKQNPYDKTRGSKGAYIRYLRYTVDGWYSKKSEEIRKQIDWDKITKERQRMAAEALIVEDAYQRGYADAMADMRKKKEQRRQREQAKKARRWYFIKQKAYGLAMLAVTVLAAWATEGDITIAVITVPLGLMCLFSKKMLIVDNYYFATEERAIHGRKNNTAY